MPAKKRRSKVQPESHAGATSLAVFEHACDLALALPGVERGTAYGTPALKVNGKVMARLRTEAEGALAIRCDFLDRQMLLQADARVFFLTDHYRNYPMVLVRLDHVRRAALPDLLERAWRLLAPKKLLQQHAAAGGRATRPPIDVSDNT